ncbi:MAG: hypothetical protein J5677_04355 [Bacteroidales bacterium]|nr:hypothetical protein [Bacteroidales bacterium]
MSIGTIVLLLLFIGVSMYSKYNKTIAAQSAPMGDSADDVEEDEVFFEEEQTPEEASPYFTYEADYLETPKASRTAKKEVKPAFVAVANEPTRPQFDLRQAVIGQVILTNNYINEINQ